MKVCDSCGKEFDEDSTGIEGMYHWYCKNCSKWYIQRRIEELKRVMAQLDRTDD